MNRRNFLASAAVGATALSLNAFSATAAFAAPSPTLPGEVSRIQGVTTTTGGRTVYDNIEVDIAGDRARLFVPQSVRRGQSTAVGAVWFHHGAGGDHNAMGTGFKYPGELVVDAGAIAICINAGGTLYSNPYAQQTQLRAWTYLSSLFPVRMNFLRATSGGGALASYTYGNDLIPYVRGMYMVNGLYDVEWAMDMDTQNQMNVRTSFKNSQEVARANNPARIPASSWSGANVKVLVADSAHPDTTVDPRPNGLALVDKIKSTASEATVGYHALGHATPPTSHRDMMQSFARWSGLYE